MNTTRVVTIRQSDDWILVQSPRYSEYLVNEIKNEEVIPRSDRTWDKPAWKVKPVHLEAVRTIVSSVARKENWEVLDYTAQTEEALEEQMHALRQSDLERHVAAALALLPKLPPRALRLVDWQKDSLHFELKAFLDDAVLFKELAQASLEFYRPTILFGGQHKREFSRTLIVAADARILRALCQVAGVTQLGSWESGSGVEYFVDRSFPVTQRFDDGVVHFEDAHGEKWVGVPYQAIVWDIAWSKDAWQVALVDEKVYKLFNCKKAVEKLIHVRESQYVNPGVGFVVAQRHPSDVARFVIQMHCEEWFYAWGNALVQDEVVKKGFAASKGWYDYEYAHGADELLEHISWTRTGGSEMAELLGWSKQDVERYRDRVKHLKKQAAQHVIDDMKDRAMELALPHLQQLTVKDLLTVGEKHYIALRKSWGKEQIVSTLNADRNVCEDIIGLTKRLEGNV